MSGWRDRAPLVALCAGLLLMLTASNPLFYAPPNRMTVADGAVTILGPKGFCIDRASSHDGPGPPFILLGICTAMAGANIAPRPMVQALLSASVSNGSSGPGIAHADWHRLVTYIRSAAGRSALSRSGDAESVRVLGMMRIDGVVFVHAHDTSPFPGEAVMPDYWRAVFDLNGHLVTLNVMSVPKAPFPDSAGVALLDAFVDLVKKASTPPKPGHRRAGS